MSECGCDGSCPVCRIGEVDEHKCDNCKTEFCQKCHGILKTSPLIQYMRTANVKPCKCAGKKLKQHGK